MNEKQQGKQGGWQENARSWAMAGAGVVSAVGLGVLLGAVGNLDLDLATRAATMAGTGLIGVIAGASLGALNEERRNEHRHRDETRLRELVKKLEDDIPDGEEWQLVRDLSGGTEHIQRALEITRIHERWGSKEAFWACEAWKFAPETDPEGGGNCWTDQWGRERCYQNVTASILNHYRDTHPEWGGTDDDGGKK